MPNTYSQLYVHIVFAVSGRQNLIRENFRIELQKYISGIISNLNQKLYAIYCMPDHVHISIKPDIKLSDLVRDIKANSSRFINEKKWIFGKFQWQEGYGAFSFREEYVELLRDFEINYKSEYLFEFLD